MNAEELTRRATAGGEQKSAFKASLTWGILQNPYGVWCDLHAPRGEAVDETSRHDKLRMDWGLEMERRWVFERHPDAVEIRPRFGLESVRATSRAMARGARAIFQPQLWSLADGLYGLGDLLVRDDSAPSDLGDWHYRVVEIKRSRELKPYQAAQAVIYNRILGRLQGVRPATVQVVLQTGSVEVPAAEHEGLCDSILATWRGLKESATPPELPGLDKAESPWRVYTNRVLQARRDLSLFPAVDADLRVKLRGLGVTTIDELTADLAEQADGATLRRQFESWKSGKPVFAGELAIPRRGRALYYDFETCDATHPTVPPHVYMIGAYDASADRFHLFTAEGPDDEAGIFARFADLVGDPDDVALYHWWRYETDQLKLVAARHPALAARIDGLARASVDLHKHVKEAVCFGTGSYSIKKVAPFLGFRWRQADVDAFESMVLYWEWLADGDDAKIARIATYNEYDCRAMAHVDKQLEAARARLQAQARER
jgi:uncharacterized protein